MRHEETPLTCVAHQRRRLTRIAKENKQEKKQKITQKCGSLKVLLLVGTARQVLTQVVGRFIS